jgi:hypothetical protein
MRLVGYGIQPSKVSGAVSVIRSIGPCLVCRSFQTSADPVRFLLHGEVVQYEERDPKSPVRSMLIRDPAVSCRPVFRGVGALLIYADARIDRR